MRMIRAASAIPRSRNQRIQQDSFKSFLILRPYQPVPDSQTLTYSERSFRILWPSTAITPPPPSPPSCIIIRKKDSFRVVSRFFLFFLFWQALKDLEGILPGRRLQFPCNEPFKYSGSFFWGTKRDFKVTFQRRRRNVYIYIYIYNRFL